MNIKDFFKNIFRDNAVTSESLEAEAMAMLAAKPGEVVPVKNLQAHVEADTFARVRAMKEWRNESGQAACSAVVYFGASGYPRWEDKDGEWIQGPYGYISRVHKLS